MRGLGLFVVVVVAACGGGGMSDAGTDVGALDIGASDLGASDLGADATCVDADGDGHGAIACGGDDCDDADAQRYPGNAEICDATGHDEDCDLTTLGPDADHDGAPYWGCCQLQADGTTHCGGDCDDARATVNPTAVETCNGVDDNCDGEVDEAGLQASCVDTDGDGHGPLVTATLGCTIPIGATTICNDCDDADMARHPGAAELCDGIDNDCNGIRDEGCACTTGATQPCGVTMGACVAGLQQCLGATWGIACTGSVMPSVETCDGIDDDCDGAVDESVTTDFFPDCDGDSYGADAGVVHACRAPATLPSGCARGVWSLRGGDCDDADATHSTSCGPCAHTTNCLANCARLDSCPGGNPAGLPCAMLCPLIDTTCCGTPGDAFLACVAGATDACMLGDGGMCSAESVAVGPSCVEVYCRAHPGTPGC